MDDLLANALMTGLDVAVLRLLLRRGRPVSSVLVIIGSSFLLLAVGLGGGMFGLMRVAAYVAFAHAPLVLLMLAVVLRSDKPRLAVASAALACAIVLVGVDAFFIEPRALDVTHVAIVSARVEGPLRIVVISDIQFESFGDHERSAIRAARAANPDVLLFTGDYIQSHHGPAHEAAVLAMNAELRALRLSPAVSAYAVAGNVDDQDWPRIFDGTGVTALTRSATVTARGSTITALDLTDSFDPHEVIAAQPGFHIVFGHSPDYALGDVSADLLIAGHTHGGQVQLPWIGPLMTLAQVPRAWASGVTRLTRGRTLVVSRGVGMERGYAPRLRFLCKPEIVVIDVVRPR